MASWSLLLSAVLLLLVPQAIYGRYLPSKRNIKSDDVSNYGARSGNASDADQDNKMAKLYSSLALMDAFNSAATPSEFAPNFYSKQAFQPRMTLTPCIDPETGRQMLCQTLSA